MLVVKMFICTRLHHKTLIASCHPWDWRQRSLLIVAINHPGPKLWCISGNRKNAGILISKACVYHAHWNICWNDLCWQVSRYNISYITVGMVDLCAFFVSARRWQAKKIRTSLLSRDFVRTNIALLHFPRIEVNWRAPLNQCFQALAFGIILHCVDAKDASKWTPAMYFFCEPSCRR